jgi:cob(I)alamin adenosyltransferase
METVKKSKIYTKTGDHGVSSLYNGDRINKDAIYFECLGDIDELNSNLGMLKALWKEEFDKMGPVLYNAPGAGAMFYKNEKCMDTGKYYEWFVLNEYIHEIQCNLMNISTQVATPFKNGEIDKWISRVGLDKSIITNLEKKIDRLDSLLEPIKNFVVPSGNKLVSQVHICRSITRRCERRYVSICIQEENEAITEQINIPKFYLNRLSDYLFVLSRFVAMSMNVEEDLFSRNFTK